MPLRIVRDDLVNARADAVVMPSNERLVFDGGAGGAVARAAGLLRLRAACRKKGPCPPGSATYTSAFSFPARYLIHAVGPVWKGEAEDARLLRSAYDAALHLAADLGCSSVALPLLSAGTYGCPAHVSLSVALSSIEELLQEADMDVTLVLFDKRAVAAGLDFLGEVERRISDAYVAAHREESTSFFRAEAELDEPLPEAFSSGIRGWERTSGYDADAARMAPDGWHREDAAGFAAPSAQSIPSGRGASAEASMPCARQAALDDARVAPSSLEERLEQVEEGFSRTLLDLIDASGMTDVEVYRRANMSRQHFSKIRSNAGYRPSKPTVLSLCIALGLDLDQTRDLLARAGFALTHASKFDIVVEYFIERGIYDQIKINETLFYFDQPLIGG